MSNYEIMLITDPKKDAEDIHKFTQEIFKDKFNFKKLENNQLSYPINKSLIANYLLINTKASSEEINEFTRKANINKDIWRFLVINLDHEKKDRPSRKKNNPNNQTRNNQVKEQKDIKLEKIHSKSHE